MDRRTKLLLPILTWLLQSNLSEASIVSQWADLAGIQMVSRRLFDRIPLTLQLYPCDLLFIHRDLERESRTARETEINEALEAIRTKRILPHVIYVLPKRMTEAWLLFNEDAIRTAIGNPHATVSLNLPSTDTVEDLGDPKDTLKQSLRLASGLHGYRLVKLSKRIPPAILRIPDLIDDFSPLRVVPTFRQLEEDIIAVIRENGWDG